MKLIIAGSRTIVEYNALINAVEFFNVSPMRITEVVSGRADGPDTMGETWAKANGIEVTPFPAAWYVDGIKDPKAGFKRNREMAKYVARKGCLLALWDGQSSGTAHMIRMANNYCRGVMIYKVDMKHEATRA